jgi:hypothetical protein
MLVLVAASTKPEAVPALLTTRRAFKPDSNTSVPAATVAVHEQRSAMGLVRGEQVPRGGQDNRESTTKLLAEGLTHLAEAIRELELDRPT